MVLRFDHTHGLDLIVSRSKFDIALFKEWEGWLTWIEKDESIIHDHEHMGNLVRWVDVPDSDWGDFRCRGAIHISSFEECAINLVYCY